MSNDNDRIVANLNRIIEKECTDFPILEDARLSLENKFFIAVNMARFLAYESKVSSPEKNIERASESNRVHLGREAGLIPINDFLDRKVSTTASTAWNTRVNEARRATAEKFPENKASEDLYIKRNVLGALLNALAGKDEKSDT